MGFHSEVSNLTFKLIIFIKSEALIILQLVCGQNAWNDDHRNNREYEKRGSLLIVQQLDGRGATICYHAVPSWTPLLRFSEQLCPLVQPGSDQVEDGWRCLTRRSDHGERAGWGGEGCPGPGRSPVGGEVGQWAQSSGGVWPVQERLSFRCGHQGKENFTFFKFN